MAAECGAVFELRAWAGPVDAAGVYASDDIGNFAPVALVTDKDVAAAEVTEDGNGQAAVAVKLTEAAAGRFAEATGAMIGKPMAIVLDGAIVSAPTIMDRIAGGQMIVTGGFSQQRAEALKAAFERCIEGQE
jgi:preprotein translocase subunit SecD